MLLSMPMPYIGRDMAIGTRRWGSPMTTRWPSKLELSMRACLLGLGLVCLVIANTFLGQFTGWDKLRAPHICIIYMYTF